MNVDPQMMMVPAQTGAGVPRKDTANIKSAMALFIRTGLPGLIDLVFRTGFNVQCFTPRREVAIP